MTTQQIEAVKAHATKAGREDYEDRAADVDAGHQNPSWAWPFTGADEAYINAVTTDVICREIGLGVEWNDIVDTWCQAFRVAYTSAHKA